MLTKTPTDIAHAQNSGPPAVTGRPAVTVKILTRSGDVEVHTAVSIKPGE